MISSGADSPGPVTRGRATRGLAAKGLASLVLALLPGLAPARAADPLPRLAIDREQITVSGLSSGGFMAVQLGYAHAATFRGVGVFAGGPYGCAGHNRYSACMEGARVSGAALARMQDDIDAWRRSALIDGREPLAGQRIFLFIGSLDETVGRGPMDALSSQYTSNGVAEASLTYVRHQGSAHVFPTDFEAAGNGQCDVSRSPFIANCGYDGAGAVLSHLYGPLAPRDDQPPERHYHRFDQKAFGAAPGLADTGWVYVPAACAAGQTCRLHVALHGCRQNESTIDERFVRNTGYTRWAETNQIVVLFPQTRATWWPRSTAASGWLPNPYGCYDWVGWYGKGYARKDGAQVGAIHAMVEHLAPALAPSEASCVTANNVEHTAAGRAYAFAGLARARGSNDLLGPWNALVETTLRRIGPGRYALGTCS